MGNGRGPARNPFWLNKEDSGIDSSYRANQSHKGVGAPIQNKLELFDPTSDIEELLGAFARLA